MTDASLDAGSLTIWLGEIRVGGPMDVPCGDCTACCRSSQFVLVEADEEDAHAHIPAELLFPAPGRPGDHVLGYDREGRCPMLVDDTCSIYERRPRACRAYDCRVFAATAVDPGEDKPLIRERVHRWRFDRVDDELVAAAAGAEGGPLQRALTAIGREDGSPRPSTRTERRSTSVGGCY